MMMAIVYIWSDALSSMDGMRIGRIKIEEMLGRGGMGAVYKGHDEILDRPVALKVASHDSAQTLDKLRFLREARVLSRLDHPNICRVHDLIEHNLADILVLEYIPGRTLKKELSDGVLSYEQKLKLGEILANVLSATHEVKVVHRDLKPDNIMITAERNVKVLDFGLARDLNEGDDFLDQYQDEADPGADTVPEDNSLTARQGGVFGTARYMSPEHARGEEVTSASDMFSFGMIMVEMFTGSNLYPKNLPAPAMVFKVGQGQFQPVEEVAEGLDPDLLTFFKDLLQLDPDKRPTAEEAARRISDIRAKPRRQARKRRLMMGLAAAALLCLIAIPLVSRLNRPTVLLTEGEIANVLIMPFANRSDDPGIDWVEWGLRQLVADSLAQHERVQSIPEARIRKALSNLEINSATPLGRNQLEKLNLSVGANFTLRTLVEPLEMGYRMRITLYDAFGPRKSLEVQGPSLPVAARSLGKQVLAWLLLDEESVDQSFSRYDQVNELFSIGMQRRHTDGPGVASDIFKVCRYLDPDFTMASAWLATCLKESGDLKQAEVITREIMESENPKPDHFTMHRSMMNMAFFASNAADWQEAEYQLNQSLKLAETYKNRHLMALSHHQLGNLHVKMGSLEKAEASFTRAAELYRAIGVLQGESAIMMNLGVVSSDRGNLEDAESYYLRAIQISKDIHHRETVAMSLLNLGVLQWDRKNFEGAEKYYRDALDIYQDLDVPERVAILYNNLSGVASKMKDYKSAEDSLLKALDLFKQLENKPGVAMSSYNLAELYVQKLELCEMAEPHLAVALEYYEDDPETWSVNAHYFYCLHQFTKAFEAISYAKKVSGEDWDKEGEEDFLRYQESARTGVYIEEEDDDDEE